jgi:hypothetical protein
VWRDRGRFFAVSAARSEVRGRSVQNDSQKVACFCTRGTATLAVLVTTDEI